MTTSGDRTELVELNVSRCVVKLQLNRSDKLNACPWY